MADENTSDEDEQAQDILAEVATDSDDEESQQDAGRDDGSADLGDAGKRALNAVRQERNKARKELAEVRDQLQTYEDRDKTETQRLTEERDRLAVELTEYRVNAIRTQAALDAGLGADMAQFITGVDEDSAAEQASLLAEKTQSNGSASADVLPRYAQGFRGKGEKRPSSVSSGQDLYSQRHSKQ